MNIHEELARINAELDQENQKGPEGDQGRIQRLQQEAADLQRKSMTEEVQASDEPYILNIGGMEVNFRALASNEAAYQELAIAVQLKLQEAEQQNQTAIAILKESFNAERAQLKEQHASAVAAAVAVETQKYDDLYEEFDQAKRERDDFEKKLTIAGEEIAALKRENDELRAQATKPSTPTNLDISALAEAKRRSEEAKPAIYDVQPLDSLSREFKAKHLETDEEFVDNYMYIGKYRVISEEEAARFRQEREEEERNKPAVPPVESDLAVEVPAPPIPFQGDQSEQQPTSAAVDGENVDDVSETKFREEVRWRLAQLEMHVFHYKPFEDGSAA